MDKHGCIDLPDNLENFKGIININCCCHGRSNSNEATDSNNSNTTNSESTPAGAVMYFAMLEAPKGWLVCDGSEVSRSEYPNLFTAIQTTFGEGDGATTFNLPELRGEFIRGVDEGRGIDTNRELGSWQKGTMMPYDPNLHEVWTIGIYNNVDNIANTVLESAGLERVNVEDYAPYCLGGTNTNTKIITDLGVSRAQACVASLRPRNIALLPCIKY